jgi:hypothetical protein
VFRRKLLHCEDDYQWAIRTLHPKLFIDHISSSLGYSFSALFTLAHRPPGFSSGLRLIVFVAVVSWSLGSFSRFCRFCEQRSIFATELQLFDSHVFKFEKL